jgi:chromosome segregation ATPase
MAAEHGQSQDVDLDKTDKLPILQGVAFDADVADDAVRMDGPPPLSKPLVAGGAPNDFVRPSSIDLPSLAESVRSVEERIARQNAEYETLMRTYERARDAEMAASARLIGLEKDLASTRASLEGEATRARDYEKSLIEKNSAIETARERNEATSRESERYQTEARTLRDSLAARDATIVQVLHSLGERDAQLTALQAEHAKVVPQLEARAKSGSQLEEELTAARAQFATLSSEFKSTQLQLITMTEQAKRGAAEINATRAELAVAKTHASSYLESLRTRDWRRGFDLNLFRDMDAKVGAADAVQQTLKSERDQVQSQLASLQTANAAQQATIEQLLAASAAQAGSVAEQTKILERAEQQRVEWTTKLSATEDERKRLSADLAKRDQQIKDLQSSFDAATQRISKLETEHAARIAELESDADTHEQEMAVLMAHLQEARRPIETIESEVKRLKDDVALKSLAVTELSEEAEKLRAALERTRGQLEEREFLIRRLERSESNNANALGRIQTSMERLGSAAVPTATATATAAPTPEWSPELVRIDGDRSISYALGRRTRIGRAAGCEMHIDSSSVSRHHALILAGNREAIIEDLNSTNGVILNGRKVTRQVLNDGDIVTIGEIQFRFTAKPSQAPPKG